MKIWTISLPVLVFAAGAVALGKPAFNKDLAATYGITKTSALGVASCGSCHVGKTKKLNPYGIDLQKAMRLESTKLMTGSVLKKVEGLDSDKDGKTNLDEIRGGTMPGDPASK